MVAPGDKSSACRTAQRGCMKAVVPQPFRGEPVHRWRWYAAAERAELAEAGVVNQDKDNVRCAFGSLCRLRELRRVAVKICPADVSREMKIRPWQNTRCIRRGKSCALSPRTGRACQRKCQSQQRGCRNPGYDCSKRRERLGHDALPFYRACDR